MKWIGQHIYDYVATFRQGVTMDSTLAVTGNLTFDSVTLTGIQTSSEVWADNDVSLMTSAAIADKIEAYGYSAGDITGVTITTDTGGGDAASDTGGSADFSILGTSGVGVTNSGTTITVTSVPGEIDHDSLLNFASNEHFTQANITTVGTIDTGVWNGTAITASYIAAAQTNITSLGELTSLSVGGDTDMAGDLTISSSTSAKPVLTILATHTDKDQCGQIAFRKNAADTEDGEDLGKITFFGENEANADTRFAEIKAEISESDTTDEAGKLTLSVAESDGTTTTLTPGLILEGEHATDGQIDVTIGGGTASTTTIAGDLSVTTGLILDSVDVTTIQTSSESYADNDTSIMTSKAIDERINRPTQFITSTNTSGATATWKLYQIEKTETVNTANNTVLDTQTCTGPTNATSGAGNTVKVTFDSDAAFNQHDLLALSIQHDTGASTSNTKFYITTIWEYDISSVSQ
jgi:hypothetical protein